MKPVLRNALVHIWMFKEVHLIQELLNPVQSMITHDYAYMASESMADC